MINIMNKIFRSGFLLFEREKLITFVNLGTTILVSFFIWATFLGFYFFNQMISFLEERLDFSIYFKKEVGREEIIKLQKILQNFPGASEVELVTQEEAFKKFQKEVKANPVISRALSELQTNPLVDYLIVRAENAEVYPKVADYLEKSPFKSSIDYTTYFENQRIIKRSINLSNQVKFLITLLSIVILIFSALIIFNTTLTSIYSQREEIEVLRLVGAGNWFIRGPFFVYSFIFTFLGYIISLGILVFFLEKSSNFWQAILSNFQPTIFIYENFFYLNGIIFLIILLMNFLATFFALEKYLKI